MNRNFRIFRALLYDGSADRETLLHVFNCVIPHLQFTEK